MSHSLKLVRAWREKSEQDLLTCKQLMQFADPVVEIVLFHAQQAVEKALKGFLVSRQHFNFPKSHDLGYLLDIAEGFESDLASLSNIVELSPFAVEARYPDAMDWGSGVDVQEYIGMAEHACETLWMHVEGL